MQLRTVHLVVVSIALCAAGITAGCQPQPSTRSEETEALPSLEDIVNDWEATDPDLHWSQLVDDERASIIVSSGVREDTREAVTPHELEKQRLIEFAQYSDGELDTILSQCDAVDRTWTVLEDGAFTCMEPEYDDNAQTLTWRKVLHATVRLEFAVGPGAATNVKEQLAQDVGPEGRHTLDVRLLLALDTNEVGFDWFESENQQVHSLDGRAF